MPILVRAGGTSEDLRLVLRNDLGYLQDAHDVRWSIFYLDGRPASGARQTAVKDDTGQYRAPWSCVNSGGCYKVVWEYREESGGELNKVEQSFFVLDPSDFQCCPEDCAGAEPVPGCSTFVCGQALGPGDMPLYLKDSDGLPANAFAVFWSVIDERGCTVVPKQAATAGASVGEYYASWTVGLLMGNYRIVWEWMDDADSPLSAKLMGFSVVCQPALFSVAGGQVCMIHLPSSCSCGDLPPVVASPRCQVVVSPSCGTFACSSAVGPVAPIVIVNSCCDFEVGRTVHLASQVLPAGGLFTSQAQYQIPPQVSRIVFYVTYTRGAPGGRSSVRLMLGNGTEESQSTMIDTDFSPSGPSATQDLFLNVLRGPAPDDDNPVTFNIEVSVAGGIRTARVLIAESGVPAAPGTAQITLTASA